MTRINVQGPNHRLSDLLCYSRAIDSRLYIAIIALFLICQSALSLGPPLAISADTLIAEPLKFDRKRVTVSGFLVVETQPRHAPVVLLYRNQEDSREPMTKAGIFLVPNQKMLKDLERYSGNYVTIAGVVQVFKSANGAHGCVISDIHELVIPVWHNRSNSTPK